MYTSFNPVYFVFWSLMRYSRNSLIDEVKVIFVYIHDLVLLILLFDYFELESLSQGEI